MIDKLIRDQAMLEAVERELHHSPPFSFEEIAKIGSLILMRSGYIESFEMFSSMRSLHISNSDVENLEIFANNGKLTHVYINSCLLKNINKLNMNRIVEKIDFRYNQIEDVSVLLSLPNLYSVWLDGNPLDDKSYYEILPILSEREVDRFGEISKVIVWKPDELSLKINRMLFKKNIDGAIYAEDVYYLTSLGKPPNGSYPSRELVDPEKVLYEIEKDEDVSFHTLVDRCRIKPQQPAREKVIADDFDYASHRKKGDSSEAQKLIESSDIDRGCKDRLLKFVHGFPELSFFCVDEETNLHRIEIEKMTPPEWWRKIRRVLAYVDDRGLFKFNSFVNKYPNYTKHPFGFSGRGPSGEERSRLEKHGLYPIGDGGPEMQVVLAIKTNNENDRAVYYYHNEDLYDDGYFVPRIAFRDYCEMFDHITMFISDNGRKINRVRS